jgi:hypothetical protein
LGGDGQPEHLQHCDTRKGEKDLKWNPGEPQHQIEQRVRFELDGRIVSDDPVFNSQLNDVLGLNIMVLRNRRRAVIEGIVAWVRAEKARLKGPISRDRLIREHARLARGNGTLLPFNPVAAWWLNQMLVG